MSSVKMKHVMVFRHGIAYFLLEGKPESGKVKLVVNNEHINDVLKSITVFNGRLKNIEYAAKMKASDLLKHVGISLDTNEFFLSLVKNLIGVPVEIGTVNERSSYVILGVQPVPQSEKVTKTFVVVKGKDGVSMIPLEEITSLKILDEKVESDIEFYINVLAMKRRKDSAEIQLTFDDSESVVIGYFHEAPVWKTTYRLDITSSQKILLQGYAIVENTTDSDWEDVILSFVSGRPISFIIDLFTPHFAKRPVVKMKETVSEAPITPPAPKMAKRGVRAMTPMMAMAEMGEEEALIESKKFYKSIPAAVGAALEQAFEEAVETAAGTEEIGESFIYTIKHPVTIKRKSAALVPIIMTEVRGKDVIFYSDRLNSKHPRYAIEFENTTGLVLEGGPATVYREGVYAGEVMFPLVQKNERRVLPYSIDMETLISSDTRRAEYSIESAIVRDDALVAVEGRLVITTYEISNSGTKEKLLLLEHPKNGMELIGECDEKTETHWRWHIKVPPLDSVKFVVKAKETSREAVYYPDLTDEIVETLYKKGVISKEIRYRLQEIVAINGKINALYEERDEVEASIENITADQERIRKNLLSLKNSTAEKRLRERYVASLEEMENRLAELRKRKKEIEKEIKQHEKERGKIIASLISLFSG